MHEDCRAAVKEARDAFIDLSGLLPTENAEDISITIDKLNLLAKPILGVFQPYGKFLSAASIGLTKVDELICKIGKPYKFSRKPRDYAKELYNSLPILERYPIKLDEIASNLEYDGILEKYNSKEEEAYQFFYRKLTEEKKDINEQQVLKDQMNDEHIEKKGNIDLQE